ncbi:ATPase [Actinoplanes sp. KI2]|uniref:N-acetylglucosamine kinase n=1 Tax=Actinoplanes sp. KI2 TaxID=2983315 RepID=UPI0021D5ECB1|nr:BadF/BadG/BcrA/BcrD ATPase family protein [Actinoplanes sp. KI2]MCU7730826.1 ATPase [Actinoplanes sp. KI2]
MDLVVGVDAGGTASRAVVATLTGKIVGRASAGPGNPLSHGAAAACAIGAAVRGALHGHDPARVTGGVLGLAGTSAAASPAIAAAFAQMWAGLGLRCPMRLVGDVVTAFAAGTPAPSGRALIAGTGAIAAHLTDHQITATADGLGWLLGDEGSGRWIGLQALRHTVRNWPPPSAADPHSPAEKLAATADPSWRPRPPTTAIAESTRRGHELSVAVAAHAGATSADALIAWAQALPLADIDALAPLVCTAARAGDPAAAAIVTAAAAKLLATLTEVGGSGPVVLAGGLLAGDTPLRDQVLASLRARAIPTATSHDPAAAAAWLAARPLTPLDPARLHANLLP